MAPFIHQRHRTPLQLPAACDLVLACSEMHSNVNFSRIVRVASVCGVNRLVACGRPKIDAKIARDGASQVSVELRRSLPPVLSRLRSEGYQVVGLEQTTDSECLFGFAFQPRTVLVVGHERAGLDQATLDELDRVAEIPVFGLPPSYNVATAAAMALYEYCRQFAGPST